MADFVGLGRMMLSYPELAADVLAGRPLTRKHVCRTFSDCTTGPRLGLVSGCCYPLDPFYVAHPHAPILKEAKAPARTPKLAPDTNERSRQIVAVLTRPLALCRRRLRALRPAAVLSVYFVQELGWTRQQVTSGTRTARSSSRWRSGFSPAGSSIASARGCSSAGS